MSRCEVCGNAHRRPFDYFRSRRHVFDSFECAVRGLTSRCAHCGSPHIQGTPRGAAGCEHCAGS
ncbi:MAG TPA: hypothetical protein VFB67_11040 [Candidatus Polarisedimenticolaceae bacterium]|nr:hypothetical protein [Candidatus Polarisedimenticolaceae bacterium]